MFSSELLGAAVACCQPYGTNVEVNTYRIKLFNNFHPLWHHSPFFILLQTTFNHINNSFEMLSPYFWFQYVKRVLGRF